MRDRERERVVIVRTMIIVPMEDSDEGLHSAVDGRSPDERQMIKVP